TRSFFKDIFQLEPAHYMYIHIDGSLLKKRYWDINLSSHSPLSLPQAESKLYELLTQSIKRRLRSDVAIGSSLSGGIDSSSIVLLIDRMKNKEQVQKTFSARFKNFEKDEGKYIDKVLAQSASISPFFSWPDEQ